MATVYVRLKELWFDVGKKRYTTTSHIADIRYQLWFDVGKKRYTTSTQLQKSRM